MEGRDSLLKAARNCHTKEAWLQFYQRFGAELCSAQSQKVVLEVFRVLKNDPQCLQYNPEIWAALLEGCLSCWNLELGREIAESAQKIASSKVAIVSAQVYMESGLPSQARLVAERALRLKHVDTVESLQLQMIICNSYVEQGKNAPAIRLLEKMQEAITVNNVHQRDLADLYIKMGRANFFLGLYPEAAKLFDQAYDINALLGNWEQAAKGLFNSAACFHNTGTKENQERAFTLVEKCQTLAIQHDLKGPLSHCYAFKATDQYQRGRFEEAAENYKIALDMLPLTETSFRRLHVVSMLAFTYLKLGRFQLASKVGKKTLELANLDKSERFRSRYLNLHAELYWEEGKVDASQKLLQSATKSLFSHGVNTLEELSALSRYYLQCAMLNEVHLTTKVKIAEQLKTSTLSCLDYMFSLSQIYLTQKKTQEAIKIAKDLYQNASDHNATYHRSLGLLALIHTKLAQAQIDDELHQWRNEFAKSLATLDGPLSGHILLIDAATAYHQGKVQDTVAYLNRAKKHKKLNFPYNTIIDSWLETLNGHSPKLSSPEEIQMVARATAVYFAPTLEAIDETHFRVSHHYQVSLNRHPILAKLLHYLLSVPGHSASAADLQRAVWKQSLASQGWQQKIRNTIMRLRECFPQTIAPLILHSDNQIRLFQESIELHSVVCTPLSTEEKILELLAEGPMSSCQLSNQIHVSQATTKRLLKKLAETQQVKIAKVGRKVLYETDTTSVEMH